MHHADLDFYLYFFSWSKDGDSLMLACINIVYLELRREELQYLIAIHGLYLMQTPNTPMQQSCLADFLLSKKGPRGP